MEPLKRRVAFLNVSKYGCKQFLNMEPLERGVAIQFPNREQLDPPVSKYGTVGTGGCKHFLNGERLKPSVSQYGTVGTGGCLL